MILPLRMMLIRSHISSATSSVCVLIRMATPRSLIRRNTSLMSRAPRGSSPTIGSSTSTALRPVQERGAHHQPLLHAVREALDQLVAPAAQLEQIEHLADARLDGAVVHAVEAAVEAQELAGGELLVDERPVGDEAERRLRRLGRRRQVVAVDEDPAGGGLEQPGDHPDRRGLAGAVGAEEAVDLPRRHVERRRRPPR